ncbi:MAG: hypothetical protein P4L22_01535, partial [Candidatus Babeliales bacterium]|nr:hypothetical protein [Candidatus Babeliales bacterium]
LLVLLDLINKNYEQDIKKTQTDVYDFLTNSFTPIMQDITKLRAELGKVLKKKLTKNSTDRLQRKIEQDIKTQIQMTSSARMQRGNPDLLSHNNMASSMRPASIQVDDEEEEIEVDTAQFRGSSSSSIPARPYRNVQQQSTPISVPNNNAVICQMLIDQAKKDAETEMTIKTLKNEIEFYSSQNKLWQGALAILSLYNLGRFTLNKVQENPRYGVLLISSIIAIYKYYPLLVKAYKYAQTQKKKNNG